MVRLQDKIAIVTGAASGMGRATAFAFAREGAAVTVTDVLEAEGEATAEEIRKAGGLARFVRHDITDAEAWSAVVADVVSEHGRLDVLVNNAGISGTGDSDVTSLAFFDKLIDINTRGAFLGIRSAAPHMARSGGGSIVNLSSVQSTHASPGQHLGYPTSKGAVSGLTRSAAVTLGVDGIRVNAVGPGLLPPMRSSGLSGSSEWRDKFVSRIPLGRTGEVEEVASAVLFLASDEAAYITGVEIMVDGGLSSAI